MRIPRSVGVILIFLGALVAFILFIYTFVPFVLVELNAVFGSAGKLNMGSLGAISGQFLSGQISPISVFSNFIGSFGLALAVIVSSFYLSIGHDGVERFLNVVTPPDYEETTMRIYARSKQLIGSWFRMQILLSVIMGFIVWVGLAILGVKYAFLIGVLAGCFELVPFLGPIMSGAVAIAAALITSTTLAIYTLIFFLIAQQFESHILVPLLSRRSVGLHPVIVIVALLLGAEMGGVLGIIIAVPTAAVFQEVIQDWSMKRRSQIV
jgi:predicted PurR-regulated permease PerM